MAEWKYPTGAYKAYVPGGRFGRGIGRGLQRLGEGLQQWGAQMLAIKQWEYEKEEKRKQRMREQAAAQVEALAQQQALQQQRIYDEAMLARAEQFKIEEAEKERQHDIKMEWLKQKGGEGDKWQADLDKHLDRLDKLQTDFAQRRADEIRAAINAGDVAALYDIQKEVAANRDLMRTYTRKTTTKEGKPTTVMEESNDINELTGALYYITRQMEQKYGKPEMQA